MTNHMTNQQNASSAGAAANGHIAVVGGGSIGVAFAVVFAQAGMQVSIFEPAEQRRTAIPQEIRERGELLQKHGLFDGDIDALVERVTTTGRLEEAVAGAALVQECIPEKLEMKRSLFSELAQLISEDCVVCSSTSFIPTSKSAAGTGIEEQSLVAHPGNPPYAIPVIELVPSPATSPGAVERARALYEQVGLSPVVLHKEIEGFLFNRLQGAVLREAYALVREGVADVDDIDKVVRDGLGRRWAFMGPFETVDLNTRGGIEAHAERMGPSYQRMEHDIGDRTPWTEDLVAEVVRQRSDLLAPSDWEQRVLWRDEQLLKQKSLNKPLGE